MHIAIYSRSSTIYTTAGTSPGTLGCYYAQESILNLPPLMYIIAPQLTYKYTAEMTHLLKINFTEGHYNCITFHFFNVW